MTWSCGEREHQLESLACFLRPCVVRRVIFGGDHARLYRALDVQASGRGEHQLSVNVRMQVTEFVVCFPSSSSADTGAPLHDEIAAHVVARKRHSGNAVTLEMSCWRGLKVFLEVIKVQLGLGFCINRVASEIVTSLCMSQLECAHPGNFLWNRRTSDHIIHQVTSVWSSLEGHGAHYAQASLMAARKYWLEMTTCFRGVHQLG